MSKDEMITISRGFLNGITEFLDKAPGWIDRGQSATVLTTISTIEDVFQAVLQTRMRPLSKKMQGRLFEGYGPFSTMAAKVDLAYALELLSDEDYADMQLVRKIRNEFAHSHVVTSFDNGSIAAMVERLSKPKKSVDTAYQWYFARVSEIGYALIDATEGKDGQKRRRKSKKAPRGK